MKNNLYNKVLIFLFFSFLNLNAKEYTRFKSWFLSIFKNNKNKKNNIINDIKLPTINDLKIIKDEVKNKLKLKNISFYSSLILSFYFFSLKDKNLNKKILEKFGIDNSSNETALKSVIKFFEKLNLEKNNKNEIYIEDEIDKKIISLGQINLLKNYDLKHKCIDYFNLWKKSCSVISKNDRAKIENAIKSLNDGNYIFYKSERENNSLNKKDYENKNIKEFYKAGKLKERYGKYFFLTKIKNEIKIYDCEDEKIFNTLNEFIRKEEIFKKNNLKSETFTYINFFSVSKYENEIEILLDL